MGKDSQHLAEAPNPSSGFAANFNVLLEPVRGPKGRLHTRCLGPFQVIGNKGNPYTLLNLVTKKEFTINVSRIVPFYFDAYRVDPQSVATNNSNDIIVESVLKHVETLFMVTWLGYDAGQKTWGP